MNCKCCNPILRTNNIKISNVMNIVLPNVNIWNNKKLCFVITTNFTQPTTPIPVELIIGVHKFKMVNRSGNYVYSDQLKNRTVYTVTMATDSLLAKNTKYNLYRTQFEFSDLPTSVSEVV